MHETEGDGTGEREGREREQHGSGTLRGERAHSQRAGGALSTGILNWKRERRKIIVPYRLYSRIN